MTKAWRVSLVILAKGGIQENFLRIARKIAQFRYGFIFYLTFRRYFGNILLKNNSRPVVAADDSPGGL
jgi:hypothetical protein